MPTGEVGAGDIANLAGEDEVVESLEGLFDRGKGVEGVEMVDVDVVGVEALERVVEGFGEVVAGAADVVWADVRAAKGSLGGE